MKTSVVISTLLACLSANLGPFVSGLTCDSCLDVSSISQCATTVTCGANQRCFTEVSTGNRTITMGCKEDQDCAVAGSAGLVGKRASGSLCLNCCFSNNCNKQLCKGFTTSSGSTCEDDPGYDCVGVNLCNDTSHAKQLCKKTCGLCDLVDGAWSDWSQWSSCSSTCGYGNRTKRRTCDNPTPAHGGDNCTGPNLDTVPCFTSPECTTNGSWSDWTQWSACSKTCGNGQKTRERYCNNPAPANGGLDCGTYNTSTNYCYNDQPCTVDGEWSSWDYWSSCTATCGGGVQFRQRYCNNPSPAYYGRYCIGDERYYRACNNHTCYRDGQWTSWSDWSSCTGPCPFGLKKRTRSCSNPSPIGTGQWCHGDAHDYLACYKSCTNPEDDIRLVGGNSNGGRVEIFYGGRWGTVCDYDWDDKDAKVACRMLRLGYNHAVAHSGAMFGTGSGLTWTSHMGCLGNETSLFDCKSSGFRHTFCSHSHDASVTCN